MRTIKGTWREDEITDKSKFQLVQILHKLPAMEKPIDYVKEMRELLQAPAFYGQDCPLYA